MACSSVSIPFTKKDVPDNIPTSCPQIGIVGDAKTISLFSDPSKTSDTHKIAHGEIDDFDGGCTYEDNKVFVDLDLFLDVKLGPKARVRDKDKATITVPYFVAIETPQGQVTAKEVFASVIKFKPDENQKTSVERLRQVVPMDDILMGPAYRIYVGFQLNQAQLDYNRANKNLLENKSEDPRPSF